MSRIRSHCCFPQRRLFNSCTSFYDVPTVPLEVDLLIEDLFDQLSFYERTLPLLTRQRFIEPTSFYRPRQQMGQQQQQRRPNQQKFQQNWQPSQIKSKNVRQQPQQQQWSTNKWSTGQKQQRNTFQQRPLQQQQFQQQNFQGKQQRKTTNMQQQQLFGGRQQQLFGRQQQLSNRLPFGGTCGSNVGINKKSNVNVNVNKFTSKSIQQKYRICVDCKCCDCDPSKLQKSIKCGANGLYHLTVCAPCKTNPAKIFKRSYTLPSNVQHKAMTHCVTPQGHCCIEFPLMEEPAYLAISEMMSPVQKIKTPEGNKAFFVQVPILPIMDPAKVKVCIKGSVLIVKFEHKKTIGDICSRVHFCCEVPLPKINNNIDISSIVCKQNKHTLNITVPLKQGGGGGMLTSTTYREIPVHRKLRQRVSSSMGMQQHQILGGVQQQKNKTLSSSQQLKKKSSQSGFEDLLKQTTNITGQKQLQGKNKPTTSSGGGISSKPPYPKLNEGVSKGSELLEEVFGFGGKSKTGQKQEGGNDKKTTSLVKEGMSKQQQGLGKSPTSSSSSNVMQGGSGNKSPSRNISSQDKPLDL